MLQKNVEWNCWSISKYNLGETINCIVELIWTSKVFWLLCPPVVPTTYSWALMITGPWAGRDSQSHVGDSQRERPHAIIYQPDLPAGQGSQTLKYRGIRQKQRLFIIDTFLPRRWADALLLSKRRSGCISCLPGLQVNALCLGMRFIKTLRRLDRVTERRRCHVVSTSRAGAQSQSKRDMRATYRYLRFSRSSKAPLGILRIWLLFRSLRGEEEGKKSKQTRVYNYNQEFILAGGRDVKEKESHEVIEGRWRRCSSHSYSLLTRFCQVMWSRCFRRFTSAVRNVISFKLSAAAFVGSRCFAAPQETCARH